MTTRRSFRLPLDIDRALMKHARLQRLTPSEVIRDALMVYLAIDGPTRSVVDQVRELIEKLTARPTSTLVPIPTPASPHAELEQLKAMGLIPPFKP